MGVLELIQQKAFIGVEFLTWLWFRCERDGKIALPGGEPLELEILAPIVLDAQYGDARTSTLKGESPATSPEARTALLEGKKLKKTKLRWKRGEVEWIFTLDGETFNISGLSIPTPGRLPFEEGMSLRMEVLEEFEQMHQQLFEMFLELRLDPKQWEPELEAIHGWVRAK